MQLAGVVVVVSLDERWGPASETKDVVHAHEPLARGGWRARRAAIAPQLMHRQAVRVCSFLDARSLAWVR